MRYVPAVRTTIEFAADTARAVEQLRREEGFGVSDAVNTLIRRGLAAKPQRTAFRQRSRPLGLRIDVSNVAAALDDLDGPPSR